MQREKLTSYQELLVAAGQRVPVFKGLWGTLQRGGKLLERTFPFHDPDSFIQDACARVASFTAESSLLQRPPIQSQKLGAFFLLCPLGLGSYGDVYLGMHANLGTRVAIKLLKPTIATPEEVQRFQFEASISQQMRHPHIVRTYDSGWVYDVPFLIMAYASHGTLDQAFSLGTVYPLRAIFPAILQIASALQYMHDRNMLHGDVKPSNMLLSPQNDVWIGDFGSVMMAYCKRTEEVRGSTTYCAPEQLQGAPEPASDQYALAVMVYQWLCGMRPFKGTDISVCHQHVSAQPPPLRRYNAEISPAVERIVLKALAKDPRQRFACVLDFAWALKQACDVSVDEPTAWYRRAFTHWNAMPR
ncbi:MAG TPA: serine/threonine-protein kinase [Ktedonobacteraceae bacterium]|nr:serine/threonine-protein kinase [Ktedonobacteraceae bacterium]